MAVRIVVFGASGDLAKRKTYPALFGLFLRGYLHGDFLVVGYARSVLSMDEFSTRLMPFLKKSHGDEQGWEKKAQEFVSKHCQYLHGQYDDPSDYRDKLGKELAVDSGRQDGVLRIFYLALPPNIFLKVAKCIRDYLYEPDSQKNVCSRLVVEKPFGKDLGSSKELNAALRPLFPEQEIYRIDHYLGKEMVKSMLVLRFANIFFEAVWNRTFIANVQVVFKETLGVEGRGGYYDEYGVIRDVLQNHMMQMLSIVAMERPQTLDPESLRDAKLDVLKAVRTLCLQDIIIGQYTRSEDGTVPGYTEDETVPSTSITPTFAMAVCRIDNERWSGVPFILRTGKGLDNAKSEIRIQFKDVQGGLFGGMARNELVLRVSPSEAVYMKFVTKRPGLASEPVLADLDLSYSSTFEGVRIPEAYESLLMDVLQGEPQNFVRSDELEEAWRIIDPVLHGIDERHLTPLKYPFGSRGPREADEWLERLGYKRSHQEYWPWNLTSPPSPRS